MANVLFSRTDSPSTKPITDGQIIFDTSGNGKMYLDNGTTRLEMGGAINVDATLDATSTNPIQNKGVAGVMLGELEEIRGVTRKGFLTDALATKTLDAKIGTTDISSIGDGTVTGAINEVNGKLNSMVTSVGITFDSNYGTITSHNLCIVNGYLIGCFSLNVTKEIPSDNQCLIFRKDAQNVSFENRIDITLQSDVIKRMYCTQYMIGFTPNGTTIPAGFYIGYICAKTIE